MKKNNRTILFLMLSIVSMTVCFVDIPVLTLVIATAVWILIFYKARASIFTEMSFILLFSYFQGCIHKTIGVVGSTLAWAGVNTPFYFEELSVATMSFLLTMLWACWYTRIISYEKEIYRSSPNITISSARIFLILAVLIVIAVFPSIPTVKFSSGGRARNESLPYGLVLLALFLVALTFDLCKKHKSFLLVYFFVCFWIVGHGERVDLLGFFSYAALKFLNEIDFSTVRKKVLRNRKRIVIISAGIVLVVALIVGLKRTSSGGTISIGIILKNFIVQPTCGDVVYVYNCSVDMWRNGKLLNGYTYIDYPLQLIPVTIGNYSLAPFMIKQYHTMGGGLFFTEPMANFGMIGVFVFNFVFIYVISKIIRKRNKLRNWMFIPIVIEIFRICWYARAVWILAVFVEAPIIYLGTKYILKGIKKVKK